MKRKLMILGAAVLMCMGAGAREQDSLQAEQHEDSVLHAVQQKAAAPKRKTVAVVLSGGGAKGMAHIGALRVIERAGIPIDIVTGTSMGSIVGGLYAIGYNSEALDSVVRIQDWSYVITDKENMTKQSLADLHRRFTYAFSTGLTLGKRNYNDGGFIKGKNLAELFQKLCAGYTDSLNFSKDLPIPFACVATNVVDNSEVDFHSGCLPQTMRASMAIPAAFSPVRMGDKVLVDGGLRNNYPADIAREMGADVIIGVTVQGAPKGAEDMGSTMSILSQIIDVNCKNKYDDNLAITDVPIRVNTTGYGAASFSDAAIDTLIRRGEEEAMKHWDELLALKKKIGLPEDYRPRLLHPLPPKELVERARVVGYTFENMTPQDERFLREKFRLKADEKDSIDYDREQQLTTSMRVDLFFQTAECRRVAEGDGVRVILTAGNRKTSTVYVGLRYDNEEHAAVQIGADFPLKALVPVNGEVTLRLGKRLMGRGEVTFHPRSFTSPTVSYTFRRNDIDLYVNGERDYSTLYKQHQAEVSPLNFYLRHFNLKMGMRWDYLHYNDKLVSARTQQLELENDHYFSYRALLHFNSEDNWIFPTRGARFKAEYAYVTDNLGTLSETTPEGETVRTLGMSELNANWRMSFTLGKGFTIQPMFYGRLLFGSNVPLAFTNLIGGQWFSHFVEQQMPFAGVGDLEHVDNHFVAAQLKLQQRLGTNHFILLRFVGAQQNNTLKNLLESKTLMGGTLAYYYNTVFGPLGASLGYSNKTKEVNFYINLGYEF